MSNLLPLNRAFTPNELAFTGFEKQIFRQSMRLYDRARYDRETKKFRQMEKSRALVIPRADKTPYEKIYGCVLKPPVAPMKPMSPIPPAKHVIRTPTPLDSMCIAPYKTPKRTKAGIPDVARIPDVAGIPVAAEVLYVEVLDVIESYYLPHLDVLEDLMFCGEAESGCVVETDVVVRKHIFTNEDLESIYIHRRDAILSMPLEEYAYFPIYAKLKFYVAEVAARNRTLAENLAQMFGSD